MLATQTAEGDLRVWSIAKPPGNDSPRVIRVLKRTESSYSTGPKWMAWSKNGKIVEYSDRYGDSAWKKICRMCADSLTWD